MRQEMKIAPSHSLVLIMDHRFGEVPVSFSGALVASTSSCVAVGTLCEQDGPTRITLTDETDVACVSGFRRVFAGVIETPERSVSVCDTLVEPHLTLDVDADRTLVEVWANDDSEPDRIVVQVGGPVTGIRRQPIK